MNGLSFFEFPNLFLLSKVLFENEIKQNYKISRNYFPKNIFLSWYHKTLFKTLSKIYFSGHGPLEPEQCCRGRGSCSSLISRLVLGKSTEQKWLKSRNLFLTQFLIAGSSSGSCGRGRRRCRQPPDPGFNINSTIWAGCTAARSGLGHSGGGRQPIVGG